MMRREERGRASVAEWALCELGACISVCEVTGVMMEQ